MRAEQYFMLQDGRELKSLADLYKALGSMPRDVFRHHVNESKNDFKNKNKIKNKKKK